MNRGTFCRMPHRARDRFSDEDCEWQDATSVCQRCWVVHCESYGNILGWLEWEGRTADAVALKAER